MKAVLLLSLVFLSATVFGGNGPAAGANAPASEQAFATKLVAALFSSDYEAFVADGDARFKELPKDQFEIVAKRVSAALRPGYEMTYLGALNQRGYLVTLWKVSPKSGADDMMATLSTRNGKVGGFFIK